MTADGKGAVFDVATEDLDTFLTGLFMQIFHSLETCSWACIVFDLLSRFLCCKLL